MKLRHAWRRVQAGATSVEYLVISVLVVIVLINGNPSPLERFFDAMKTAYAKFSYAMSLP
jgi:Flp pilus assembly pilin Flp